MLFGTSALHVNRQLGTSAVGEYVQDHPILENCHHCHDHRGVELSQRQRLYDTVCLTGTSHLSQECELQRRHTRTLDGTAHSDIAERPCKLGEDETNVRQGLTPHFGR